ncbi:hypothetical protein QYF61_026185, partial [Mycteria americana]
MEKTRGNEYKLHWARENRTVNHWNNLPRDVVEPLWLVLVLLVKRLFGKASAVAFRTPPASSTVFASSLSETLDMYQLTKGQEEKRCTPRKCGRGVTDAVITREEAERIRRIAERGLSLGGSDGGRFRNWGKESLALASILDLHSGALSLGKHFVNLYRYFGDKIQDIFTEEDFALYRDVRRRIQQRIAQAFGISSASMYLTKPTFFSRINNTEAKTTHDEYWHPHVDKVTYGSFDYTSLLYLSDYTEDFGGGRFVFMDAGSNKTIEPRAGRVSFFTSGSENLHRVEKVHWGTRYAITISFTCNPDHGIGDPVLMILRKAEVKVFDRSCAVHLTPLEWEVCGWTCSRGEDSAWLLTCLLRLQSLLALDIHSYFLSTGDDGLLVVQRRQRCTRLYHLRDKYFPVVFKALKAFKLKAKYKKFMDAFVKD